MKGEERDMMKKGGAGDEQLEEFVSELKLLRTMVREVGENFILRREGEIETLLGYTQALPGKELRRRLPEWLGELRRLKLKPRKGRMRDLKEIDRLVEELTAALADAQDTTNGMARKHRVEAADGATGAEVG
jgi:hypothetical protein